VDPVREKITADFSSDEKANFLALLLRIATADDVSPQERDLMLPVAKWVGADEQEMEEAARRAYDQSFTISRLCKGFRSTSRSLLLYRECCAVVWVDGRRTEAEAEILDELSRCLALSEESVTILNSPLSCSPEGERRFLEYLGEL